MLARKETQMKSSKREIFFSFLWLLRFCENTFGWSLQVCTDNMHVTLKQRCCHANSDLNIRVDIGMNVRVKTPSNETPSN